MAPATHSLMFSTFKKKCRSVCPANLSSSCSQMGFALQSPSLPPREAEAGEGWPRQGGTGTRRDATTGHVAPRDTWPHGPRLSARQGARCAAAVFALLHSHPAASLLLTSALVCREVPPPPPCQQTPSAAFSSTQSHPQTPTRPFFAPY